MKGRKRDETPDEPLERSDQVAASAAPQGDGVPDDESVTSDASVTADIAPTEELQRQIDEQRDKYLRLAAEYDNYRKRTARERQEASARGQADLVKQLIDSLDDLARVAHVDPESTDTASVVQGVDLVERKLLKALTGAGLEIVNPVDQTFNPALHEAVATVPALSREDDHTVAQVYQPGYLFNGQLLRPARVVVKQWNG
ncbi:MAG TPA: nucleotide exchange factor GrpE [Gemmatimonadaceae bacterium]|nr:nucleotide exchange factor GrpE [Gemmatimonadaceae bacterium]